MMTDFKLPLGSRCIKYLMFIFNLLFVITGIILISIGVSIRAVYDDYQHLLDDKFFSIPTFLIVLGSIIFFIAFFGCCGAIRESYCMILTFTGLLILVFIMELSAGIAGYVRRNEAHDLIELKMSATLDNYNSTAIGGMWDEIQRRLKCCGVDNATDWIESKVGGIPMSCCKPQDLDIEHSTCNLNSTNLYSDGCLTKFSSFIKSHTVHIGGAGIGLAFVQAIGIWFAIYLARAVKLSYDTV